jgi:hypothetical protein
VRGKEIFLVHDLQKKWVSFGADQSHDVIREFWALAPRRGLELPDADAVLFLEFVDPLLERRLIRNTNGCETKDGLVAKTGQRIESREIAGLSTLVNEVVHQTLPLSTDPHRQM